MKLLRSEVVSKLKQKTFIATFCGAFLLFLVAWCFGYGVVVLLLRQLHFKADFVFYGCLGLILAALYGLNYAILHKVSEADCIAAIDGYNKAGGLLVSEFETGDSSWNSKLNENYELPEIKTDYSSKLKILFVAVIFLVGCFFVPVTSLKADQKLNLNNKAEELNSQIELLNEENFISQAEKEELQKVLENITENSDSNSPSITFEALDQLEEKLKQIASSNLKKRITNKDFLNKLEDFNKNVKKVETTTLPSTDVASGGSSVEQTRTMTEEEKMSGLVQSLLNAGLIDKLEAEKMLEQARKNDEQKKKNAGADAGSGSETKEGSNTKTSSEQNQHSSDSGSESQKQSGESGLPSEGNQNGDSQNSEKTGVSEKTGTSGELGTCEKSGASEQSGTESVMKSSGKPGEGGGTNNNLFGDLTSDHNAKFHEETLPEANTESMFDTYDAGEAIAVPNRQEFANPANDETIKNWNSNPKYEQHSDTVLPKHRKTVKNYFSE